MEKKKRPRTEPEGACDGNDRGDDGHALGHDQSHELAAAHLALTASAHGRDARVGVRCARSWFSLRAPDVGTSESSFRDISRPVGFVASEPTLGPRRARIWKPKRLASVLRNRAKRAPSA